MRFVSLVVALLALSVAGVQAQSRPSQQASGATRPRMVSAAVPQTQQTPDKTTDTRTVPVTEAQTVPADTTPVTPATPIELAGIEPTETESAKTATHLSPQLIRSRIG